MKKIIKEIKIVSYFGKGVGHLTSGFQISSEGKCYHVVFVFFRFFFSFYPQTRSKKDIFSQRLLEPENIRVTLKLLSQQYNDFTRCGFSNCPHSLHKRIER